MKKKTRLTIMLCTVAMLTACQSGKPSQAAADTEAEDTTEVKAAEPAEQTPVYDTTDALTFGLRGHVQRIVTECYSTYESDGELKEGSVSSTSETTFDQWGHVTRDEWGNEYGYDADGNYYRGNHTYTTVKRDKAGRLQQYTDVEPKSDDNDENQTLTFGYDKSGRLATVKREGWTAHWTEKYYYQSSNIYPSKLEFNADYEGGGSSSSTITYTYVRLDEQGNWTERTCVSSVTETEEDPWSENGEKAQVTETITIEKRTIEYYD